VQINIVEEVRRVTAIARVGKRPRGEEVAAIPLWRYDPESAAQEPRWLQVKETEMSS